MQGIAQLLTVALLACLIPSWVEATKPLQRRDWKGRYKMGSGMPASFQEDNRVYLTIGRQSILCETEGGGGVLIPIQGVLGVAYDNVAKRHYLAWEAASFVPFEMYESKRRTPTVRHLHYLDLWLWEAATTSLAETFKSRDHFVNIVWREGGLTREVVFELGKKHYRGFLDQIQEVTGVDWVDLPQARKEVRQDLEEHRDQAISVELDRAVAYKDVLLEPGPHQLILLEREKHGALFFFRGREVYTREVVLMVPVEVMGSDKKGGAAEVIYQDQSHGQIGTIEEIRLGERVLRFP